MAFKKKSNLNLWIFKSTQNDCLSWLKTVGPSLDLNFWGRLKLI